MGKKEEAIKAVIEGLNHFQPIYKRHRGILGDGSGTVSVPGRPGFVYIRPRPSADVSGNIEALMVRPGIPPIEGYPVIFGKDYDSRYYQVLSIDYGQHMEWLTNQYIKMHHEQHEMPDGFDIVWVQKQQIIPMLARPMDPATMTIYVESDYFTWASTWKFFVGATSEDLTARVPVDFGKARFVLVSIDGATNTLIYENGTVFNEAFPPSQTVSIPAPSTGSIPIVAVYLTTGITAIDWANLYDVRLFMQGMGGSVTPGVHNLLDSAVHGDTQTHTPAQGDVIVANAANVWTKLSAGSPHELFKLGAAGFPEWDPFDWDDLATPAAADMVHDHTVALEGDTTKAELLTWIGW